MWVGVSGFPGCRAGTDPGPPGPGRHPRPVRPGRQRITEFRSIAAPCTTRRPRRSAAARLRLPKRCGTLPRDLLLGRCGGTRRYGRPSWSTRADVLGLRK